MTLVKLPTTDVAVLFKSSKVSSPPPAGKVDGIVLTSVQTYRQAIAFADVEIHLGEERQQILCFRIRAFEISQIRNPVLWDGDTIDGAGESRDHSVISILRIEREEKEGFVLFYGATDAGTELLLVELVGWVAERIVGLQ